VDPHLRRIYLTAAAIALAASAASLAWRDSRVTFGVAAGVAVSVVPFATWHWIIGHTGERRARRKPLVLAVVVAKYAVLAGAMWVLFRYRLVHPYGFGAGLIAGPMAVLGALNVKPGKD
jgi:hypothetical protein